MAFPRVSETSPRATTGLPSSDRCDACGAQALAKAYGSSGSSALLFCRHHAETNREKLEEQGFTLETFYGVLESAS